MTPDKIDFDPIKRADSKSFSITATDLLEFLYCPRFTFFERYLMIPEHQEKRFKVLKGRSVHEDKAKINPDYLRKKIGCIRREKSVHLSSRIGIRGIIDEILFLSDGTAAPLDYKFAEYKDKTFKNHRFQLAFYAQLIKENYNLPVSNGFIVYTRSQNKMIEVPITEHMLEDLKKIVLQILDVIQKGIYPEPTRYKARCADCCYGNLCEQNI
jgi:CRISPR-associated exonuclease Cas4